MDIQIELEGEEVVVAKKDYVAAKTKDLKEFGYNNLTEQEVEVQLDKIMSGEKTDVIGGFIERDNPQKAE